MGEDKNIEGGFETGPVEEATDRREFLLGLKKWSKVVIGLAVAGAVGFTEEDAEAGSWINRRGGWVNKPWGNGSSWANGGGGWANRHGSGWANGGGGWANRHGGGSWINNSGGGGWANRHGGGGWINFK